MTGYYDIQDLKKRLRRTARDVYQIQWNDALLDEIINEAQREYALYSGCLTGRTELVSDGRESADLPADFIRVLKVFNPEKKEIPIKSFRQLAREYGDFRKISGVVARCAVFDFDGHKKYRIFPVLPAGMKIGTMYYERLPQTNILEVKNIEAVEAYALYMMFLMTGKDLANVWYDKFMKLVRKDNSAFYIPGIQHGYRTGRFY